MVHVLPFGRVSGDFGLLLPPLVLPESFDSGTLLVTLFLVSFINRADILLLPYIA